MLVSSLLTAGATVQTQSGQTWRPANFRGLVIGRARQADMIRLLGKPKWTRAHRTDEPEERQSFNHYEGVGEFPGNATVVLNERGLVARVDFYPAKLSRTEAVAHFGADYIVTRYAFDQCKSDEDEEALYESPSGPITVVEYRGRGVAIFVGANNLVTKISYIAQPVGRLKSQCS